VKDATSNAPAGVQGQAALTKITRRSRTPMTEALLHRETRPRMMRAEQPRRAVPKIKTVQARWQPNPL
jgi:hypothetical protein